MRSRGHIEGEVEWPNIAVRRPTPQYELWHQIRSWQIQNLFIAILRFLLLFLSLLSFVVLLVFNIWWLLVGISYTTLPKTHQCHHPHSTCWLGPWTGRPRASIFNRIALDHLMAVLWGTGVMINHDKTMESNGVPNFETTRKLIDKDRMREARKLWTLPTFPYFWCTSSAHRNGGAKSLYDRLKSLGFLVYSGFILPILPILPVSETPSRWVSVGSWTPGLGLRCVASLRLTELIAAWHPLHSACDLKYVHLDSGCQYIQDIPISKSRNIPRVDYEHIWPRRNIIFNWTVRYFYQHVWQDSNHSTSLGLSMMDKPIFDASAPITNHSNDPTKCAGRRQKLSAAVAMVWLYLERAYGIDKEPNINWNHPLKILENGTIISISYYGNHINFILWKQSNKENGK